MSNTFKRFAPNRLQDYSKSAIIEEIRRVIRDECEDIVPTRDHFEKLARVSHPTIARHFGTYTEAIRQAGFVPHKHVSHARFTAEQVKANLFEVLKRANGYCFTQDFYRKNGGIYCEEVCKARLCVRNWQGAMEAIGAKKKQRIVHTVVSARAQRRNFLANVPESDLFREIDRIWRIKGRRPSYSEFIQFSQLGVRVYETRYGSWTKAIEAFCKAKDIRVQGLSRSRPTKNILLQELQEVQLKLPGAILTYDSYKANGGTYSVSVFRAKFGNWTSAVNAAGSISGEQARYSKDELFEEMQRLWEQFGRQPKQVEMLKEGKISPKCYTKMFGSWTKAVHAFCADRNDPTPPTTSIPEPQCSTQVSVEPERIKATTSMPNVELSPKVIEHTTGRTISLKLRFMVLKRDNFTCKECKRSPATHLGLELEVDHVNPYSNRGETDLANLQTLCKRCNRRKSNKRQISVEQSHATDTDKPRL